MSMKEMNFLSKRMQTVVNMVSPQSFTIADVGCDHAYVSIALIKSRLASKVIAMDVRKGPLEIAKRNVIEAGLESQIELRLGDGLERLSPMEADTIIIAGMGGLLIKGILERGIDVISSQTKRPTLILQPQSDIREVRLFLSSHAYDIVQEDMLIEEGKYYTVIKANPQEGAMTDYSEADWVYGQYNLQQKSPVLKEYLEKERDVLLGIQHKISSIVEMAENQGDEVPDSTVERLETVRDEIRINQMALDCY